LKPLTASMSVVLPAPLGPMSPTTSPGATVRSTPSSATTPPKRTRLLLREDRRRGRCRRPPDEPSDAVEHLGDAEADLRRQAVRELDEVVDREQTGEQDDQQVVDAEQLGHGVRQDTADRDRAADHRAADEAHAAEHGLDHDLDRVEDAVVREQHRAGSERQQDATQPGDRRADPEAVELRADDGDTE
jgi:hypothetical protein